MGKTAIFHFSRFLFSTYYREQPNYNPYHALLKQALNRPYIGRAVHVTKYLELHQMRAR